ncbi:phosphatidate cytidylyltransferase [Rhodovulum sulfidophilum]|uniref:UDP-2,3-diacylglucosamine diphosphatase LpxI n=1 Tax=Rhodovulum visakhapatnamense TaxID=364297 RepID=A0ABS1RFP5_9RHOB|nr:UDP-2,3-diacylglucosamine diphosphatase LpxI [Rhodovulum visakhapatnamense]MBL3568723.1 UDP-2,3-diacylglucosamine diphosphatase LpxI [Rhodovulum visakhapatnamense]MBL3577767.1 UDP-2,3-diacylglucosamine diphosphatase LpxI [Rhodovulum visakhapatnamense]OLS46697.1 phosphatidate cytidylyltransferase [Rhodovulum sulfidophilum]
MPEISPETSSRTAPASGTTALIAGGGALPAHLARAMETAGTPFLIAQIEGFAMDEADRWPVETFALERLAVLFDLLHGRGVTRVVLAGTIRRPRLDPERIDPRTAQLLPRILPFLGQGDDGLLRAVIALFEEDGFAVVGADAVAPDLLPAAGVLTATAPSKQDEKDAARAAAIVEGLGAVDVGQGAVVAQGLCLAVETLPGTDAMLAFVAEAAAGCRPDPRGARGVVYKAPKPGQDRRVDLPAIGPATVEAAHRAGLAGIVLEAGGVMVLDRAETVARADALGVFIWVREP